MDFWWVVKYKGPENVPLVDMGGGESCSLSHSLPFFFLFSLPQIPMVWNKPKASEHRY